MNYSDCYTVSIDDVDKPTIHVFGQDWRVDHHGYGSTFSAIDVGKRVTLGGNQYGPYLCVERDHERVTRVTGEPYTTPENALVWLVADWAYRQDVTPSNEVIDHVYDVEARVRGLLTIAEQREQNARIYSIWEM